MDRMRHGVLLLMIAVGLAAGRTGYSQGNAESGEDPPEAAAAEAEPAGAAPPGTAPRGRNAGEGRAAAPAGGQPQPDADADPAGNHPPAPRAAGRIDFVELIQSGGVIGYLIMALSVAGLALFVEHLLSIRSDVLMPQGLAETVHTQLSQGQIAQAQQQCKLQPSFLGAVLGSGLAEIEVGHAASQKAMEDAAVEQSARLFRKIEYLSVIGTIAPMLGLLGTVWGMILAFMEFEAKANPQVSELAPGIYRALVTTFLGLCVSIPALAAYSFFRNRVDELVAQTTLLAEHVFSQHRRLLLRRKAELARRKPGASRAAGGERS